MVNPNNDGASSNSSIAPVPVLFLDHTARWSGGEIALFRFLTALDRKHYTPIVVAGEDGVLVERLHAAGVRAEVVPLGNAVRETRKDSLGASGLVARVWGSGADLLTYAGRIARFARGNGCRIIHCNSLKSDIYGAIAGKRASIPVVWHIRDHLSGSYLPPIAARALRMLSAHLPSRVLVNSYSTLETVFPDEARRAGAIAAGRAAVIHDCVDETFLSLPPPSIRATWRDDGDTRPLRIGIVGRLTRWKGQHVFLEAAGALARAQAAGELGTVPPLRFVIAGGALFGEEAYEREVRAQATALDLDTVEWLGNVADIPALLCSLDILVHASITPEPFGQVVIEGMAAGLPVIATDGGGVRETVADGVTGLLTPMGDAAALAVALRALIANPARAQALGAAGYADVRARFTPARTAHAIEAVYRGLLGG